MVIRFVGQGKFLHFCLAKGMLCWLGLKTNLSRKNRIATNAGIVLRLNLIEKAQEVAVKEGTKHLCISLASANLLIGQLAINL
jgi:hypothetical protein